MKTLLARWPEWPKADVTPPAKQKSSSNIYYDDHFQNWTQLNDQTTKLTELYANCELRSQSPLILIEDAQSLDFIDMYMGEAAVRNGMREASQGSRRSMMMKGGRVFIALEQICFARADLGSLL